MPPLRRYLRITRHSVLECRIYLDNPHDAPRWLLHPHTPMLPRVIAAVRPLVLPKLREENARARGGKGGKRRGWKDVVVEDEFEVAVFLTETSARHSILRKEKRAVGKRGQGGKAGGGLSGTREVPVEVGEELLGLLREDSDGGSEVRLGELPAAGQDGGGVVSKVPREESGEGGLFVSDGSEEEDTSTGKGMEVDNGDGEGEEDKKKLGLDVTYHGFSIYGRILCLVVKRKGMAKGKGVAGGSGQAVMEEWISSTQMGEGRMMDD